MSELLVEIAQAAYQLHFVRLFNSIPVEERTRGDDPPRASYAARVRDSDFGRRFIAGSDPNLPVADLDCCAAVDRFDFALPIRRVPGGLVIRRADHDVTLDRFRHDAPFAQR